MLTIRRPAKTVGRTSLTAEEQTEEDREVETPSEDKSSGKEALTLFFLTKPAMYVELVIITLVSVLVFLVTCTI